MYRTEALRELRRWEFGHNWHDATRADVRAAGFSPVFFAFHNMLGSRDEFEKLLNAIRTLQAGPKRKGRRR